MNPLISVRRVLVPLLAIATWVPSAMAESEPAPAVPKAALPQLPWHMVNLWWTAPEVVDFTELSIDVDISADMPADQYNLYISPFSGSINGELIYGGIQTNVNGWNAMAPADKQRLHGGHGFIFSRWSDKPDLTLDFVRATPGGFVETAGYEGHFASARRPYAWKAGKYTYALRKMDTQMVGDQAFTWVGAFVHEHGTHQEIFVGALRFAGNTLKHNGRNAGFMEFYSTSKIHKAPDIAKLPPLEVKFSNLRFNGQPADLSKVDAAFIRKPMKRDDGLGAPISPNLLHVTASPDGKEITCKLVNQIFPDAEEPNRTLWKK